MAEVDRRRHERASVVQPLVVATSRLSRAPISVRLLELLIPLPR